MAEDPRDPHWGEDQDYPERTQEDDDRDYEESLAEKYDTPSAPPDRSGGRGIDTSNVIDMHEYLRKAYGLEDDDDDSGEPEDQPPCNNPAHWDCPTCGHNG